MAALPDKLKRDLAAADRKVEQAKAKYDEATQARASLIVAAAEGTSMRAVAEALGKSTGRVRQILERERAKAGS
jgi:cellobiose-specific phosphotransferase system component IIA